MTLNLICILCEPYYNHMPLNPTRYMTVLAFNQLNRRTQF